MLWFHASMERVKPLLRWPGGKSRLLKKLLPLIPEHECYGEVFGGGLALFGAKPRSPLEIVNDVNGDLIALYLNVQRHLPEMLRQIDLAVSSRELLYAYVEQPGLTDIERAARFLIRNRTSFGGSGDSFAVCRTAKSGGAAIQRGKQKALLEAMHERLDGVVIEHLSWDRFLELYDQPKAFFFLDPPYVNCPTKAYAGWTEDDARQLQKRLSRLNGKWLLTINDSPFTRSLFSGCEMESVVTKSGTANNRTHPGSKFGELIITP
jgi:DNA adenine methylase